MSHRPLEHESSGISTQAWSHLGGTTQRVSTGGEPLPDDITLSLDEAKTALFTLDAALEQTSRTSSLYRRLERAAQIIVEKFLPDLPEL